MPSRALNLRMVMASPAAATLPQMNWTRARGSSAVTSALVRDTARSEMSWLRWRPTDSRCSALRKVHPLSSIRPRRSTLIRFQLSMRISSTSGSRHRSPTTLMPISSS